MVNKTLLAALSSVFSLVAAACSSAPQAVLELELELAGAAPGAAEEVKRRVELVSAREALPLGELVVRPREGGLTLASRVPVGESCAAFDRAHRAMREGLVEVRRLAVHEVLEAEAVTSALAELLRGTLGEASQVKTAPDQPFVVVEVVNGVDVPARARALSDPTRLVVAEFVDRPASGPPRYHVWALAPAPALSEREVRGSKVQSDGGNWSHTLGVTLTDEGAARFGELTGRLVKRYLAILVDGEVVSVPIIQEAITGGAFVWTVEPTKAAVAEAERLALTLPFIAERVVVVGDASRCPAP